MNRFSRYADYVPVAAILIGFILIGVGWNGAAGLDYVQGQIPYLISGGLIGLGFILFGSTAMLVQAVKRSQARQQSQLEELSRTVGRVASAMTLGLNGRGADSLVVIGSSSFHKPSCRMVGGRKEVVKVPRESAVSEGLDPCRICKP